MYCLVCFRLAEELLAKVRQLGVSGTGVVGNVSVAHIHITLSNITDKLRDLRRHLTQVEDRVHAANSINTANRRMIISIQVSSLN